MAEKSVSWGIAIGVLASLSGLGSAHAMGADAFVRTPWSRGAGTEKPLSCASCQWNKKILDGNQYLNRWTTMGVGVYSVVFTSQAPAAGQKAAWQVHALNAPGVTCASTSQSVSGNDYRLGVSCFKGTQPTYSRFLATLSVGAPVANPANDEGHARVAYNALITENSWASHGAAPVVTRTAVGRYTVRFPDFHDLRGNAQVSMDQTGARCRVESWNDSGNGVTVSVRCQNFSTQDTDAAFSLNYYYKAALGDAAWAWANNPSFEGSYAPQAAYQRGMNGPVTVSHTESSPGVYLVTFNDSTVASAPTKVDAEVTAGFGSSICVLADLDERTAQVRCVNQTTGAPQNSVFSFRASYGPYSLHHGFTQIPINGTNFKARSFDAGHGLFCGEGGAGAFDKTVLCVAPSTPGTTGETRPIGGGVVPGGTIKSIAVDNIDATDTQVLVLSSDSVVRYAYGNISGGNWGPPGSPLGAWFTYVPALNTSGQAVTLAKIAVVRTIGSSTTELVALTTGGQILSMVTVAAGRRWAPSVFHLPAGSYTDISHGRFDLYARRNDNVLYRDVRDGTARALAALPNGILPVALGGRHVLTNAGFNGFQYPCTAPKDSSGNYVCAGDPQREFRWAPNGIWVANAWYTGWPTSELADVLTSGQPFVSQTPTIVDMDLFEGNLGAIAAWQYYSRVYEQIYFK